METAEERLREDLDLANEHIRALHAVEADLRERIAEQQRIIGEMEVRLRAQAQALQGMQAGQ